MSNNLSLTLIVLGLFVLIGWSMWLDQKKKDPRS